MKNNIRKLNEKNILRFYQKDQIRKNRARKKTRREGREKRKGNNFKKGD